jgi:hypothetical protein
MMRAVLRMLLTAIINDVISAIALLLSTMKFIPRATVTALATAAASAAPCISILRLVCTPELKTKASNNTKGITQRTTSTEICPRSSCANEGSLAPDAGASTASVSVVPVSLMFARLFRQHWFAVKRQRVLFDDRIVVVSPKQDVPKRISRI